MSTDRMELRNMQFFGYHGVFPEENRLGQKFIADVVLDMDLSKACQSDALQDTVDYAAIYEAIRQVMEEQTFQLIERLAEAIAESVLAFDTRIQNVDVSVTKPNPPFRVQFDGVTIRISRKRKLNSKAIGFGTNQEG